jgi:hypothetical protein
MTAQSQRRTLLSFCSLYVPLHLTRLLPFLLQALSFWLLMPKGEREFVDSRGAAREGFLILYVLLSCIMFKFPHLHCVTCVVVRYLSNMLVILSILYHVTCLVLAHTVLLSCFALISDELYYCVLTLLVSSYEYTLLAWST